MPPQRTSNQSIFFRNCSDFVALVKWQPASLQNVLQFAVWTKPLPGLTNPTSTLDKQTKVPGTYFQRGMLSCISNIYLHAILFNRCIALCDTGGHGAYDDTMTGFCQCMHRSSSISSPHHICDTGGHGRTGCCHQCTGSPRPCCHCDRICLSHEMVKRDNCTMPPGEWSISMMFGATEDEWKSLMWQSAPNMNLCWD